MSKEEQGLAENGFAGADLRRHGRVPLRVPVECRSEHQTASGKAENLSRGGMLVRAERTLAWDEEMEVTFKLPGSTETLQARARVAHVVPDAFMGVEFLDLPPATVSQIEKFIAAAAVVPPKLR